MATPKKAYKAKTLLNWPREHVEGTQINFYNFIVYGRGKNGLAHRYSPRKPKLYKKYIKIHEKT